MTDSRSRLSLAIDMGRSRFFRQRPLLSESNDAHDRLLLSRSEKFANVCSAWRSNREASLGHLEAPSGVMLFEGGDAGGGLAPVHDSARGGHA